MKDSRKLIVEWPMPPVLQKYKAKPSSYLSHLVGHEGGGSLLSLLKVRCRLRLYTINSACNSPALVMAARRRATTPLS